MVFQITLVQLNRVNLPTLSCGTQHSLVSNLNSSLRGLINSAVNGDANGSIPTSEPQKYRKMYGQYGGNITHTAMTFVSNTAYENGISRQLNLQRVVRPVKIYVSYLKQI